MLLQFINQFFDNTEEGRGRKEGKGEEGRVKGGKSSGGRVLWEEIEVGEGKEDGEDKGKKEERKEKGKRV